jgi:hypothetical protein
VNRLGKKDKIRMNGSLVARRALRTQ